MQTLYYYSLYNARFRERAAEVHSAVKRRLDYQVELINTKKRFEQDHMVNWIVNNVVKGITPKQVRNVTNTIKRREIVLGLIIRGKSI